MIQPILIVEISQELLYLSQQSAHYLDFLTFMWNSILKSNTYDKSQI